MTCYAPSNKNIKTHEAVSECRQKHTHDSNRFWKKRKVEVGLVITAKYRAMKTEKK